MGCVRQLGIVFALLLSLLAPTMACALPNAQMTAQEHACCKKMKGNCGSMRMPTTHSCCQQSVRANHLDAIQPESVSVPVAPLVAVLPSVTLFHPTFLDEERLSAPQHSPPTSPPHAVSVLRI